MDSCYVFRGAFFFIASRVRESTLSVARNTRTRDDSYPARLPLEQKKSIDSGMELTAHGLRSQLLSF